MARVPTFETLHFVEHCEKKHVALVDKIISGMFDGTTLLSMAEARSAGRVMFFEVGDADALIITSFNSMQGERELFIVGVAGTGILNAADAVVRDLKELARSFECRHVSGLGTREGWVDFALEHGFRKLATYYSLDLEMN